MGKQRRLQSALAVIQSLGWPILLGLASYTAFMLLLTRQVISSQLLDRYLTSHPVSYVATAMFFVGVASLALKTWEVFRQYQTLGKLSLDTDDQGDGPPPSMAAVQSRWEGLGKDLRATTHYLFGRIGFALDLVERRGSSEGLEDELKYQADLDSERQHQSHALVRILIWATPMLGFLGTVIGISEALGGLNVGDSQDFDSMMQGLRNSLYVAFDTTALALTLSIGLMFFQFLVDRFEQNLLTQVESRATQDLLAHFPVASAAKDPVSRSIERSGRAVLEAVETLVDKQSDLWEDSFLRAQKAWATSSENIASVVHTEFKSSVHESLADWHQRYMAMTEEAEQRWQTRWEQLQIALTENARRMQSQQEELIRHSDVLGKAVAATADVLQLEDALNRNLQQLNASGNFEEAVMSLSATINLLNSRLAHSQQPADRVELKTDSQEKAA